VKGYRRYFFNKLGWFAITFVFAFLLNFMLPRMMPGDPVAAIVARQAQGMSNTTGVQAIYEQYTKLFATDKPMHEQFFIYVSNVVQGDFGFSFSQYPRRVTDVIGSSIWWTLILQLPAILVGWIHWATCSARWRPIARGALTKCFMPSSPLPQQFPALWHGVILLVVFAVNLRWFPTSGGYGFDLIPSLTPAFFGSMFSTISCRSGRSC
jgi:peptide/nickel transport system permease protein